MRPTKKPRRACGTLRGETAACGPAASGNSDWQEILGEQLFGGITKKCDAWPKGSAGRLPGAFGGWGSVLGLVEHGLALALHPISCCRQHHACAQHQVCQPAAGAGLDQLGILHRREHRGLRSGGRSGSRSGGRGGSGVRSCILHRGQHRSLGGGGGLCVLHRRQLRRIGARVHGRHHGLGVALDPHIPALLRGKGCSALPHPAWWSLPSCLPQTARGCRPCSSRSGTRT